MSELAAKIYKAGSTFTPSAPVSTASLFSGRTTQISTIIDAIAQVGQHAIIYGERGVGKTSLANVISAFLPEEVLTVRLNCDSSTSFEDLFRNVLSEIKLQTSRPGLGFGASEKTFTESLDAYIDSSRRIEPNALRALFSQFADVMRIVITIDELDRIEDTEAKKLIADTIKNFSDYNVNVTFVLVGVADSVSGLIAGHQSIERALVQVQMPRMVTDELNDIITKGLEKLGMTIENSARKRIVGLSQGLPHYTHLLTLEAVKNAIMAGREHIDLTDAEAATTVAINKVEQSVRDAYHKATNSPRGNLFQQVLLACAMANTDTMGYFAAGDVRIPLKKILKRDVSISAFAKHQKGFCDPGRGPVLTQTGFPRRYRYRFVDPMMAPFVIMDGLAKGLISGKDLS